MKKRLLFLSTICSFALFSSHAQISGIINQYTPVTAIDSCTGKLTVSDTTGFRVGNTVLLIQMQGADIVTANNASFGTVSAMNSAGFNERAVIESVSANTVFLKNRLVHPYNPAGKVQLVTIPKYASTIATDTLRAKPWDGSSGGILALEVTGTLSLNAPVNVSGTGFRGGADYVATGNACNALNPITGYVFGLGNWRGGYKGEGIALLAPGLELGRGPQANGGGGGNDHNAGGGGGSNVSDGGNGGNNADPNPFGCNGYFPGLGGYAPASITNRLFMGGGGGAGHSNNLLRSKGGTGGGIVILKASAINGSAPVIYSNGTNAGLSLSDGAGGGGAGGTIWLELTTPNPNLTLQANGGRGGSADNNNVDRCMGPGGGGSGGRILTNASPAMSSVTGGNSGITINSTISCNNSSNTAESGNLGVIESLSTLSAGTVPNGLPQILQQPLNANICPGKNAVFTLGANPGNWTYQWQLNAGATWQDIQAGSIYAGSQSDSLILNTPSAFYEGLMFRCKVSRPGCSEIISNVVTLHFLPASTAAFTTNLNGATASFNNQSSNATNYLWDFGDGQSSTLANPMHTYATEGSFTVTLSVWGACDTVTVQHTVNIILPPSAGFSVPATVFGCGTATVNFLNLSSSNTTSYAWTFPGGTPGSSGMASPSVSYSTSGTYTARLIVSNSAGKDTLEKTFQVEIFDLPAADFDWQAQANGVVTFTNQSQNGETFTWDFGDGSPQLNSFNAQHDYASSGSYVVTLIVSSPCGVSIVQEDVVVQVVGTMEKQGAGLVQIFPNPAGEWLKVAWNETNTPPTEVRLFDPTGKLAFMQNNIDGQDLEIPLQSLPTGVFQLLISFEDRIVSRAVVKGN